MNDGKPVPVRLAGAGHWGWFVRSGGMVKVATLCGRMLACPMAKILTPGQVSCEVCKKNHKAEAQNEC